LPLTEPFRRKRRRQRCDALFGGMSGCSVAPVRATSETSDAGLESSEDGWAVTKPLSTLTTRTRRASMQQSSAGPEVEVESAQCNEQVTPAETKGVEVEVLATVDLAGEIEGMDGRQLRMRMVTIERGGLFGPIHEPTRAEPAR